MIALHNVLNQVVNIHPGINSLITGVHHVEIIDIPVYKYFQQRRICHSNMEPKLSYQKAGRISE